MSVLLSATATAAIVLHLNAPASRAFPMFDPVNEARWAPGWHPTLLGDGRVESGLVFTTEGAHGRTSWLLDRFDAAAHSLRYVVSGASMLTTIDIDVVPDGPATSRATVTYTRTALEPSAEPAVREFAAHFPSEATHWETAINGALAR